MSYYTSKIELQIDNLPPDEAELLKQYFIVLIAAGLHKVKNAKMVLYFDDYGLNQIGTNVINWKRKCNKDKKNPSV